MVLKTKVAQNYSCHGQICIRQKLLLDKTCSSSTKQKLKKMFPDLSFF